MFAKNLTIANLLDFYGDILNEKAHRILEQYYCDDLSLAEIADNEGISRQGVRSVIKHSEASLLLWESKLGLASRFREIRSRTGEIASLSSSIPDGGNAEIKDKTGRISALCAEINAKL